MLTSSGPGAASRAPIYGRRGQLERKNRSVFIWFVSCGRKAHKNLSAIPELAEGGKLDEPMHRRALHLPQFLLLKPRRSQLS